MRFLVVLVLLWRLHEALAILRDSYTLPAGVMLSDGLRFDYIVVGAGAGGAAAAAGLVRAGASVLLVEAGGDPNLITKIPSAAMALLGSEMDWQYKTIPNNVSCLASQGRQCRFSRGKCLGGSTSINYMLYTRGNPSDFEDFPVPGWTWEDLRPYVLRSEGLQVLDLLPASSKSFHNTTGPMFLDFFDNPKNPWHTRLKKSYKSLGFLENPDINAMSQIGVSQVVGYVHKGERMSTARGYLAREEVRRALKVAKNTLCTGVIIDENKIARGITVVQDSRQLKLYAKKEVILSAGTVGSPQILMLSGIGPAEHLQSMGINVKVNLPGVGADMSDHMLPLILVQVDKSTGIEDDLKEIATYMTYVTDLFIARSGPLTSNGLTDVNTFFNSHCYDFQQRRLLNKSFDGSDCEVPNFQLIHSYVFRNLVTLAKPLFQQTTGFNDNVVDQISKASENHALIVITPILLAPHSRGHIRLASSDPLAGPAIYPNYLDDDRDVDEFVRTISIIKHILETKPFKTRKAKLLTISLPGCPKVDEDVMGYWQCYTRHMTFAVYHAVGTCPLGSVLDARLRVRGVRRLRVADLSVLPRVPRASTATVTMAIGERVVDLVLEDNK